MNSVSIDFFKGRRPSSCSEKLSYFQLLPIKSLSFFNKIFQFLKKKEIIYSAHCFKSKQMSVLVLFLCQLELKSLSKSPLLMYRSGRSGPLKYSGFLLNLQVFKHFLQKSPGLSLCKVGRSGSPFLKSFSLSSITKGILFHNLWKMILYCHIYLN